MVDHSQLDDYALLKGMVDGDEQAFIELYRRRQAGLYRFALRMAGSPDAAEDAVQETFLVLLRRTAGYDPARGSVSAFLYGIARNCVRRGLERTGSLVTLGDAEMERRLDTQATAGKGNESSALLTPPSSILDELSREEEVAALQRAILSLPENYRAVVLLCDLEELSYKEAATAMGCAVGTVRSRLHRGRALLGARFRRNSGAAVGVGAAGPKAGTSRNRIKPVECEA